LAPRIPGLKRGYYALRGPVYRKRKSRIAEILKEDFEITSPIRFFNHHYAHATSAYYTSSFQDSLVVTMDGGGDGHCSHIYSVKDGNFQLLVAAESYDSVGNFYAYITAICGFKAKRHEGKITGLAARGKSAYLSVIDSMIGCEKGRLVNRGHVLFNSALDAIRSALPDDWKREDLAASIQEASENIARDYISFWLNKSGHRNVALAGGLFANVRINEEILNIDGVDNLFVHPGMSDEGLAVGAALAYSGSIDRNAGRPYRPKSLPDVYLGTEATEKEIYAAIKDEGLDAQHMPGDIGSAVAEKLANGKVVARFAGPMEYGPRALGNRSILYQPGDPSVNDWLNELLKRTEFMPFAPSCLYEAAEKLFVNTRGGLDTARFMTVTFHCTPWMIERCKGVVHVDDTARPQLVTMEDNPSYYAIIKEYYKRTGVPAIINTSFNIHEEPIVRTPEDAIRAFLDSSLDYLAIGDFLIKGPVGSAATRKKWEGKSIWGKAAHEATAR
jgi:carbamoyltransferase